jgi:hypothetical protein
MAKVKTKTIEPEKINTKGRFIAISAIAIIISIVYSYKLRWLGDDIFIGLRYVQNFLDGNGLVYNKGEKVEGFTDFLWIMLISFFSWLKCNPLITVQTLGILSAVGTLTIFSVIVYKISSRLAIFIVPFITIALALNYDFNTWSTSGLEASFFSFLLSCSFYIYFFSEFQKKKKLILSGLFICLALLTRPDTIVILFVANGLIVLYQLINKNTIPKIISILLFFNLAIIFIYIPYFIWRYNYYGFIFPNTYYDKLGNESLFSKGFYYIWLYFKPHFISFLIIFLPPFIFLPILKKNPLSKLKEFLSDNWNAAYATCIAIVYSYLLGFVAKVGGDFMYARFIIPIAPFIYFIIFYSILKLAKPKNLNIIFVILICGSFVETKLRLDVFQALDKDGKEITTLNRDIADERYVYTSYFKIEDEIKLGKAIHRAFEGIDAKLLIRGGQACMGYYANFNYTQEFHGLTDTLIAHSVIKTRGRIGHEKHGTTEYFQNKGINFLFNRSPLSKDQFKYAELDVQPFAIRTEIITYNNVIIAQLRQKLGDSFKYTDFQVYLDDYIKNKLPLENKDVLKADYDNFYLYYFKHNNDKERETIFLTTLGKN